CYWLHARYRVSRLGRATVAVRDEPIGASALGISGYLTKVAAFAVGSAFAALAGGLFSFLSGYISPDAFSSQLSILFLVMVVLGGSGSRFGPVVGAILLVVIPLQLAEYPHLNTIIYGLLLIVLMRLRPRGLFSRSAAPAPHAMRPLFDAVDTATPAGSAEDALTESAPATPADPAERTPAEPTPAEPVPAGGEPAGPQPRRGPEVLRLTDVRRSFGGVDALAGVSLSLARGEILGLIGPNGSGKTTLLNVVCGHYPPTAGEIHLDDEPIAGRRPEAIARLGVARTFQTPKTFDGMSIEEHLALATARGDRDPETLRACRAGALALLELGGLDPHRPARLARESRVMSHGQLRFLEAATAISTCPRVLLLDEPAAGLSAAEIEGFERVVHDVARAGVGVIIVEHHLEMISRLVDRVVVLDLGKVLWAGPPADLHDAESVRAAYMGIV
ncbi:MAG: ATP-binding cassette domain-containing protein, partial [Micromonosporaceae bacterium]|nr:ATP-binding cassette domain-containing protein [Micromonosporaceae bacterium]